MGHSIVDRRAFVGGVTGGGLSIITPCLRAQPAGRRVVIGYLSVGTPESNGPFGRALDETLVKFGYVEGRNCIVERRYAGGAVEMLPTLAAELVRLRPNAIVGTANREIAALRDATSEIPIVMVISVDPVGAGFIGSLARPGGNITGLSAIAGTDIRGKRLELLKEIVPGLRKVAVLRSVGDSSADLSLALERAATALDLTTTVVEVRVLEDFERGFASILEKRPEALFLDGASLLSLRKQSICDFALKNRIPTTFAQKEFAQAGLLMTYGPSISYLYKQAAVYVDKVLRGAKPADLPVEQPSRFELVVNLKTAKTIGVTIPQSLLLRADEVIQ